MRLIEVYMDKLYLEIKKTERRGFTEDLCDIYNNGRKTRAVYYEEAVDGRVCGDLSIDGETRACLYQMHNNGKWYWLHFYGRKNKVMSNLLRILKKD